MIICNQQSAIINHIEASMGFEPMMRVLQTLALPLGHDAIRICRFQIADLETLLIDMR